jgi:PhnB protein
VAFHPYLNFNGDCRAAFTRYQEILGGELMMMTMGDLPEGERPPDMPADLVMHAALTIGDDLLMASDVPDDLPPAGRVFVNCTVDEVAEAERVFKELSDGGEVTMPIQPTFWSPMFGMCIDRFGTPWMVNTEPPEGWEPDPA